MALAIMLIMAGCIANDRYFSIVSDFKYRLTVTFEEGGHAKIASGVTRVIFRRIGCLLPETPCYATAVQGEAIPVNFLDRNQIFVLLGPSGPCKVDLTSGFTGEALRYYFWHRAGQPQDNRFSPEQGISLELSRKDFPGLVSFNDLKDPRTARWLDPDNINIVSGSRPLNKIKLTAAKVEVTTDPVTHGLLNILPWAGKIGRKEFVRPGEIPLFPSIDPDFLWYIRQD